MKNVINEKMVSTKRNKTTNHHTKNLIQSLREIEKSAEADIGRGNLDDYLEIYGEFDDKK